MSCERLFDSRVGLGDWGLGSHESSGEQGVQLRGGHEVKSWDWGQCDWGLGSHECGVEQGVQLRGGGDLKL